METLEATAVMVALLLARIALPVTITFLFGLFMNRLVNRGWVEE